MDAFDRLGIAPQFWVDQSRVQAAYLAAVARVHPDLARGDPDAAARSAELNDALATLMDDERRARAIIHRFWGTEALAGRELPDGFLVDIMGIREEAESDLASGGGAALVRWRERAGAMRAERMGEVGRLIDELTEARTAGEASPREAELLREVREQLNAWRYVERMLEQIEPGAGTTP
ncbi:MAG: DnaJ domain-containing protein [Phycisphaerales bacterium]|jgi:molecular chaperone HscB|nr:DnaJ domain-containing protein [Phycisphaerales bacterium]